MEPDFESNSGSASYTRRIAIDNQLSGSSTALGMARTFKALRQRSAFFLPIKSARELASDSAVFLDSVSTYVRAKALLPGADVAAEQAIMNAGNGARAA
jgi:hypothetical protein